MLKELKRRIKTARVQNSPVYRLYPPRIAQTICDSRCAVSGSARFVYFRIPKAANSTVVATLHHAQTGQSPGSWREMEYAKKGFRRPSTFSRRSIEDIFRNYFKFTIVRNPYSRLVSAFLDKIADGSCPRPIMEFAGKSSPEDVGFDDFLDYLEFGGGIGADPHWARQTDLIFVPLDELDFIGRFENLNTDLEHVLKRLFPQAQGFVDWVPHATGADSKIKSVINRDNAERVAKLYRADFELLGYSTDLY